MPGTFPRPWESRNNSGTMMTRLSTGLRVIAAIPIARPQISVRYSQAPSAACSVPVVPARAPSGPRIARAAKNVAVRVTTAVPAAASSPAATFAA
jgi:hypothetical protein